MLTLSRPRSITASRVFLLNIMALDCFGFYRHCIGFHLYWFAQLLVCTESSLDTILFPQSIGGTNIDLHRLWFVQSLFIHRHWSLQTLLCMNIGLHRYLFAYTLLCRDNGLNRNCIDNVLQRLWCAQSLFAQTLIHRQWFVHILVYTNNVLYNHWFSHKLIYRCWSSQTLLCTDTCFWSILAVLNRFPPLF